MPLTAAEQYLLELINRARLDPGAEAARLGLDLNAGLAAGTIGYGAQQVLAQDEALEAAALAHSQWMIDADVFSHTGANNSSATQRMTDAGYSFTGSWRSGENLAFGGSTGAIDLNSQITGHYDGLFRSAGHRANTLQSNFREIGIAQVEGQFISNGTPYNASMLTETFARSGTRLFVTGVAYDDRNGDAFYGIGEGRAAVWFAAGGGQTNTAAAGGYRLAVTAGPQVAVDVGIGSAALASLRLDLSQGNAKLDLVTDAAGGHSLATSVSATLVSGVGDARLLGIGDLSLTGTTAANRLTGNAGNNVLSDGGGAGADTLAGHGGNDTYIVRNAGTVIDECACSGTVDRVSAGVSFALAADDHIEVLTTTSAAGTGAINLTGNARAQSITGNAGANVLSDGGGAGADTLTGNAGNDTYHVRNAGTVIVEGAGQGTADRVATAVSFTLAADDHIEVFTTNGSTGTSAIRLTGNALAQSITGNAGANVLNGRAGHDVLTGGAGADTFVFADSLGAGNIDRITDFNGTADTIRLENAVFTGLGTGTLTAAAFRASTTGTAGDASDRILHDTTTGRLYFDADGTGSIARVAFADLTPGLALTIADFLVV